MVGVKGVPVRVEDRAEEGKYIASALPDKAAVDEVMTQLERATWRVRSVEKKETRRKPQASVYDEPAAAAGGGAAGVWRAPDDGRGAAAV